MRRITYWALSTLSALVLLFSYRTSTSSSFATGVVAAGTANAGVASGSAGVGGSDGSHASTADPSASGSTDGSTSGSSSTTARTYTGDAVSTRFGDVQVQITVTAGKVTKAVVTQVPWSDHRDQEINGYAVPILNGEAVTAQSASIDMVSGATYTSDGYIRSLQSALDQAHL